MLLHQVAHQLEARGNALLSGLLVPDAVDGIVIVADGSSAVATADMQSRQRQIDFAAGWLFFPKAGQMRARLVHAIGREQRLSQAQGILPVLAVIRKRRAIVLSGQRR